MKLRFLTIAEIELADAATYYELKSNGLGLVFLEELERTIGRILEYPTAWSPSSLRTRGCQMKRFPYSVIYREYDEEIVVMALHHHKRKPEAWESRLKA